MKLFVIAMLGMIWTLPAIAEDKCESAVDSADSMNVNQMDCDYTDKGLNGALHKVFKRNSEGAVLKTTMDAPSVELNERDTTVKNPKDNAQSVSAEVDQWSNIEIAKTQLLPKVMTKCPKGFSLLSENYRPLAMGRIELSVAFRCLE
jgi:uncharacterized protein YecT (DUF1311 family)